MICTPVDVVGVSVVLSPFVVTTVEFIDTTGVVIDTLASDVNTVMSGLTVVLTLLTVLSFLVVFLRRFLVVWRLETAVTVVGVMFFEVLAVVDDCFGGTLEDVVFRERLEVVLAGVVGVVVRFVTFGALVVRAVLFLKVLFTVRTFFRLVKVVTLGVLGLLRVDGVGEVYEVL